MTERYRVERWRYVPLAQEYQSAGAEELASKPAALRSARKWAALDGATPDVYDNLMGVYLGQDG